MQPYQPYNPNYMNQYQTNAYMPIQPRYQQAEPMYQQPYQPLGQQGQLQQSINTGLNGKIVDSAELITANDVPMDGNIAVFPKRDFSEIYAKSWKADGTIQTIVYKPVLEQKESETANTPHADLSELYEDVKAIREEMTERFDRLEKSMTNSITKISGSRTKKEVDS